MSAFNRSKWPPTRLFNWCLSCILSALLAPCAQALDRGLRIDQLTHDRWTKHEGAPLDITSIAQTPDGFLWLGSAEGLFRFDGVRFEKIGAVGGIPLLHDALRPMVADASGALWIAYRAGGVSVIRGSSITNDPERNVAGFAVDPARGVWSFARSRGVELFSHGQWQRIGETRGFQRDWIPTKPPTIDRKGDVWIPVIMANRKRSVAHLANGSSQFVLVNNPVDEVHLAETPTGTLWAADLWGLRPLALAREDERHPTQSTESWLDPKVQLGPSMADRDGALWVSMVRGLGRIRYPELLTEPRGKQSTTEPELVGPAQGLTSDVVGALYEDREGSVWIGTVNGLDRFRNSAVATVVLPRRNRPFAMAAAESGAIWACNSFGKVMRVTAGRSVGNDVDETKIEEFDFSGGENFAVLHRADNGVVWVGGYEGGIWRGEGGKFEAVAWGGNEDSGAIYAITTDKEGGLWISSARGVYHVSDGKWTDVHDQLFDARRSTPSMALAAGPNGDLWTEGVLLGVRSLRRLHAGTWTTFPVDEVGVGTIVSLQFYGDDLWIGGERGVAIRKGDRFVRLHGTDGEEFERTSGVVVTDTGDVWLNSRAGAAQVAAAELASAIDSPTYRVKFTRVDANDHLLGNAGGQQDPVPSAIRGTDGRVWLATNAGIHWIDPKRAALPKSAPPAAVVTGFATATTSYANVGTLQLPPGTRELRVDFTAPYLSIPQRVRFRHRLIGVDDEWRDSGVRREAFYTNLGPGDYEFKVNATNESGMWAPTDTRVAFSISPWFWQTRVFLSLCVFAAGALLWGLFAFRLHKVRQRLEQLSETRLAERERIARELHDTLLQSVQALALRIYAASRQLALRVPAGDPTLADLEKALERADQVMVEGRDRVLDLRSADGPVDDLQQSIASLGAGLAEIHSAKFSISVDGKERPLSPTASAEAYGIAREGIVNAARHARSSEIEVQLIFGDKSLHLRIRDDGVGMNESAASSKPGHWGLTGMRERAGRMGARLDIWSGPNAGTEIDLQIPAAVAYRHAGMRWRFWLPRSHVDGKARQTTGL